MKTQSKLLLFILTIFLFQSCVSFKPSVFDSSSRRYNDYKRNYSILVLDGYNQISSDMKEKLRQTFFPTAPKDITIFYNKNTEAMLGVFAMGNVKISSINDKQKLIKTLEEEFYKTGEKCDHCRNMDIIRSDNDILVEFDVMTEFADAKAIMKIIPYPLSIGSDNHSIFAFYGGSKVKMFKELKKDHLVMQESIQLPAFTEEERKPQ